MRLFVRLFATLALIDPRLKAHDPGLARQILNIEPVALRAPFDLSQNAIADVIGIFHEAKLVKDRRLSHAPIYIGVVVVPDIDDGFRRLASPEPKRTHCQGMEQCSALITGQIVSRGKFIGETLFV